MNWEFHSNCNFNNNNNHITLNNQNLLFKKWWIMQKEIRQSTQVLSLENLLPLSCKTINKISVSTTLKIPLLFSLMNNMHSTNPLSKIINFLKHMEHFLIQDRYNSKMIYNNMFKLFPKKLILVKEITRIKLEKNPSIWFMK